MRLNPASVCLEWAGHAADLSTAHRTWAHVYTWLRVWLHAYSKSNVPHMHRYIHKDSYGVQCLWFQVLKSKANDVKYGKYDEGMKYDEKKRKKRKKKWWNVLLKRTIQWISRFTCWAGHPQEESCLSPPSVCPSLLLLLFQINNQFPWALMGIGSLRGSRL